MPLWMGTERGTEAMQTPVAIYKPYIRIVIAQRHGTLSIALHEIMTELMGNLYNFMLLHRTVDLGCMWLHAWIHIKLGLLD